MVSKVQKVVLTVSETLHNLCVILAIHPLLFPSKQAKAGGSATRWLPLTYMICQTVNLREHVCIYEIHMHNHLHKETFVEVVYSLYFG